MQEGQCGSQMGTKFLEAVCCENGIGGDGKYCDDNDAQRRKVLRTVFFRPGNLVNQKRGRGQQLGQWATAEGLGTNSSESPCIVTTYVVN
jgi:hypothetical protein